MLEIVVPKLELFDNEKQEFIEKEKEFKLQLEHSLVSLSKWESKWKKPFLTKDKKVLEERTKEEFIDYIRCMTITQNVPDSIYDRLTSQNIIDIKNYMEDSMTATWFKNEAKKPSNEVITSEILYYWMIENGMDVAIYQKWHLNRLFTLLRVITEKSNTKPMKKGDILRNYASLNKARRKH